MTAVFAVRVTNELTRSVQIVYVAATCVEEARVAALHRMFRVYGWRKCSAPPIGAVQQVVL